MYIYIVYMLHIYIYNCVSSSNPMTAHSMDILRQGTELDGITLHAAGPGAASLRCSSANIPEGSKGLMGKYGGNTGKYRENIGGIWEHHL
jgi:hypothetical protein